MTMNEQTMQESHEQCEQEKARLQEELKVAVSRAQYLASDFDMFRKRAEKERLEMADAVTVRIFSDLLEIVDNFDRAFADLKTRPDLTPYVTGFELVYQSLKKLLPQYGIEEITENETFDPAVHEAIAQVAASDMQSGAIVAVLQKGYRYKGRLLRPARVTVAQ